MALIYIAEDDDDIREVIEASLLTFQYEIKSFCDGEKLLEECESKTPDCILLDIMMPVLDGMSTLKMLREKSETKNLPIILLTAKSTDMDIISGLEAGADDYIKKPFSVLELVSRVKAALRTSLRYLDKDSQATYSLGNISIVPSTHSVYLGEELIPLTLKEYNLLIILVKSSPGIASREHLLKEVWGFDFEGESRTLDMHIRSLRVKLKDPSLITTIRGVGFRLLLEDIK